MLSQGNIVSLTFLPKTTVTVSCSKAIGYTGLETETATQPINSTLPRRRHVADCRFHLLNVFYLPAYVFLLLLVFNSVYIT